MQGERPVFKLGDLSVDLVPRVVKVRDKVMKLSPKEYDLLRVMVQHAGKLLTHKFLLNELWAVPIDAPARRIDAWPHVRLWHIADISPAPTNVCYWG